MSWPNTLQFQSLNIVKCSLGVYVLPWAWLFCSWLVQSSARPSEFPGSTPSWTGWEDSAAGTHDAAAAAAHPADRWSQQQLPHCWQQLACNCGWGTWAGRRHESSWPRCASSSWASRSWGTQGPWGAPETCSSSSGTWCCFSGTWWKVEYWNQGHVSLNIVNDD